MDTNKGKESEGSGFGLVRTPTDNVIKAKNQRVVVSAGADTNQ